VQFGDLEGVIKPVHVGARRPVRRGRPEFGGREGHRQGAGDHVVPPLAGRSVEAVGEPGEDGTGGAVRRSVRMVEVVPPGQQSRERAKPRIGGMPL